MKVIACRQGTPEWHKARAGLITASCFADAVGTVGGLDEKQQKYVDAILKSGLDKSAAMTLAGYKAAPTSETVKQALEGKSTVEPSDTARRYAADLAIEQINGGPFCEPARTWLLERGHELEDIARRAYEVRHKAFVTEQGIVTDDAEIFGYSTDGMVNDDGLIEVKCPIDGVKIMKMLATGDVAEYMHQMQGGMWLTGRKWCDFIMYAPMLASVGKDLYVKRVMRDDAFIDAMALELARFNRLVKDNYYLLKAKI